LTVRLGLAAVESEAALDDVTEMVAVAERWRPYRSLAVSYLFASEYDEGT
jgi:3-methyladenine DNA glycosylase/8-oxoguanine DNA glycosylase